METEPPVSIGFLGDPVPEDDHTRAEALNKFGGRPVWIDGKTPSDYPFTCSSCGAELDFVCQVATPYGSNKRCLYFFGCHKQAGCSKSPLGWKVVRGVVEPEVLEHALCGAPAESQCKIISSQLEQMPADPSDWMQAAFGNRTTSTSETPQIGRKPMGREQSSTSKPATSSSSRPGCRSEMMPPFFVHVESEPPDSSLDDATGKRARVLQLEYEQREREGSADEPEGTHSGSVEVEAYEESQDKVFLKLQKRLSRSPMQLIRYSFGGKPLFISPVSKTEGDNVGTCPQCGSERVFEMQLVPAAAEEIHKRRHSSAGDTPIEWGVVAVFTCKEDCLPTNSYTFEHLIVQEIF